MVFRLSVFFSFLLVIVFGTRCTSTVKPVEEQQTSIEDKTPKNGRQIYPDFFLYPSESHVKNRAKVDSIIFKSYTYTSTEELDLDMQSCIYFNKGGDTVLLQKTHVIDDAVDSYILIQSKDNQYVNKYTSKLKNSKEKLSTIYYFMPRKDNEQDGVWDRQGTQGPLRVKYNENNEVFMFLLGSDIGMWLILADDGQPMEHTTSIGKEGMSIITEYDNKKLPRSRIIGDGGDELKMSLSIINQVNEHGDWTNQIYTNLETNKKEQYLTREIFYRK